MSFDNENRLELETISKILYKQADILNSKKNEFSATIRSAANYITNLLGDDMPIEQAKIKLLKGKYEILINENTISLTEFLDDGNSIVRYWKHR